MIAHGEIHVKETQKYAQEPVKKAVFKLGILNAPLVLHRDYGSLMKRQDFQNLLNRLGIIGEKGLGLPPEIPHRLS